MTPRAHANRSDRRLKRAPRLVATLTVALLSLLIYACATPPSVGVRRPYRGADIPRIAVVPFWSSSPSTPGHATSQQPDPLLETAQRTSLRWLAARRVDVQSPEVTRRSLEDTGAWHHFAPDGRLRRNLPSDAGDPDQEALESAAAIFADLHARGAFPSRWVLVGQLLYHTTTTCWLRADKHAPRATVLVRPDAPASLPRPCVVSHLQARLFDARSGSTVWLNHQIHETHLAAAPTADDEAANVRAATLELLQGKKGLDRLIPKP